MKNNNFLWDKRHCKKPIGTGEPMIDKKGKLIGISISLNEYGKKLFNKERNEIRRKQNKN